MCLRFTETLLSYTQGLPVNLLMNSICERVRGLSSSSQHKNMLRVWYDIPEHFSLFSEGALSFRRATTLMRFYRKSPHSLSTCSHPEPSSVTTRARCSHPKKKHRMGSRLAASLFSIIPDDGITDQIVIIIYFVFPWPFACFLLSAGNFHSDALCV